MDLAILYCYNSDCEFSVNLAFFAVNRQQIFQFLPVKNLQSYYDCIHIYSLVWASQPKFQS